MSDPVALAQIRTLARAVPPAYQSIPHLMVLLVLKATQLLLHQGLSDLTAFFLAQYAIAHLAMTGDHRAAYRFGKLAIDLGSRSENAASLGSAYFVFAGFTGHWCEPFASTVERLDVGFKRCLDSGDLLHAAYCQGFAMVHRRIAGMPLQHIRALLPAATEMVDRCGDVINRQRLAIQERLLVVLAGEGEAPGSLNGGGFDEQRCKAELPATYLPTLHAAQAMARFHAGQFEAALAAATASKPSIGLALNVDLRFYEGLARAALARRCDCEERTRHVDGLSQCLAQFETWSALCPANQEHRRALLAASLAELRGDVRLAMDEYDRAIAAAQSAQCLQNHALGCELCGEFHLRDGRPKIARLYLADAVSGYESWGALGKVAELLRRFPDLNPSGDDEAGQVTLPTLKIRSSTKRKRASSAAHATGSALDFESAMRAAQAIASELASDKLLDRLLRILVEAAGAQRGVLVVPKDDDFVVEGERRVSPDEVRLGLCQPLASSDIPEKLVRLAARSHETLVWGDAMDASMAAQTPRGALALPLLHQGKLSAVLYLENRAVAQGFSSGRLSRLQFLAAQAAAALENSRLYEQVQAAKKDLEERVRERTGELLARNNDLRNVLDTVNQGLVTIDRSGRLMGDSSACAAKWFGPLTEGMSWFDVLAAADPGYAKELQAFFIRIAEGKESPATLPERMPGRLVRDGRILEIELRPVGSEDAWERMLVVVSDVTDHDRKAKLEIELRQAQKLQAIGELAAGIAHEINTPAQFVGDSIEFLAGAVGQTFELVRKYRSAIGRSGDAALVAEMKEAENTADMEYTEENAPGAFERARDGVVRIATIVRAMKEFAHPDHRQKATADLNRAIETTLTIARNEYKYVAEVETKLGELPLVFCHVGDINQVFLNLIVNASHAISDVVGKSGDKGRIVVRTFNERRSVRIEIADTGCGIPAEIRDRIFDPFFTTKAVGRGSGQGLAIARNIVVEKHGGSLTFESEVGKGTTFTIVLPVGGNTE
jgi:signal transduction histidine kinase